MNPQPQIQQIPIDLSQATDIICSSCSGKVFQEAFMLKKASKFLTGGTKDTLITLPVIRCVNCGNINKEFLPQDGSIPEED